MENSQPLLTKENLTAFSADYNFCNHERDTFGQILSAIENNDLVQLDWFAQFGNRIRHILLNSYAYTKGLEFGFTNIEFDEYGWLKAPEFLDQQDLHFGLTNSGRYGTYSTITLGRGINAVWTYGLRVCLGTSGSCSGICVYGPAFPLKEDALGYALKKLRNQMLTKVGHRDTSNYNQKVILATIKDLEKFQLKKVQLSLF